MNTKSSEARISMLENQVAVLTSMREKNSNVSEEELRVRISKLESKVAELTSMNEALINLTNYLQVDVANLKSTKRKFDLGSPGVSQAKKRKLYSDSTFTGEVSECSEAVKVYTDGSCFHNGRYNASAGIGVYWGPDSEDNVSEKLPGRQTNNRAEIYAAIKATEQAIKKNIKNLIIHTDSMFLINCITKWIHTWKRNGWVKSDGGEVINKEELQELDALLKNIHVKWVHVSGHSGIPGNGSCRPIGGEGSGMQKETQQKCAQEAKKIQKGQKKVF